MSDLEKRFKQEFIAMCNDPQPVVLELTKLQAWSILSALQLASRHPLAAQGETIQITNAIARTIQGALAQSGALAEVAEKGWNPDFDEEEDMY